jgi:uncharacterized spore protein YtfJ
MINDSEDRPAGSPAAEAPADRVVGVMERLVRAASVSSVFGEPVRHGDTLLIPAAEVLSIAGFGVGTGGGTASGREGLERKGAGGGGGGGGRTLARGVAVIVSSPGGVRVEPVLDFTKIALAALTAAGFVAAAWSGMAKRRSLFRA